jgi:hypothetical protein
MPQHMLSQFKNIYSYSHVPLHHSDLWQNIPIEDLMKELSLEERSLHIQPNSLEGFSSLLELDAIEIHGTTACITIHHNETFYIIFKQ